MPRYPGQNLASVNPEYRKEHKIDDGSGKTSRYTFGKNVVVAAGDKILSGGFCMRLLPLVDQAASARSGQTEFVSFREGRDQSAIGDWCRIMTSAYWVGNPGVCFIIHDGNPELDIKQSPYFLLRDAARVNKETPGIGRLFTELTQNRVMNSHIGSLSQPEKMLFVSATSVYVDERGQVTLGAFSEDPKRNARVIGLKYSATQSLYSVLNARDPQTGEFYVNDMLSFGPAQLLSIVPESFQAGPQKQIGVGEHGPDVFHCPAYARSNDANAKFVIGRPAKPSSLTHYCIVHDTFRGQQISLEGYEDRIISENRTLDDMLYVPSYEEQAELLSRAFPSEVLEFAWQDYPEYRKHLRGRTTTSAASQPAAQPVAAESWSKPVARQTAPAQPIAAPATEGEISEEEAAGVADMFSEAPVPKGATVPPPPPRVAPGRATPAEIMSRVRKSARKDG